MAKFNFSEVPGFDETMGMIVAEGCPKGGPGGDSMFDIVKGLLQYKLTPEQIAEHYIAIVERHFGGDWQKAARGHAANFGFTKKKAADLRRGEGIGDIAW